MKLTQLACSAFLALVAAACQTHAPIDESAPLPEEIAPPPQFMPATYLAPIHVDRGRYADLFSPASYAVWIGADVAAMKRTAALAKGERIDPGLDRDASAILQNYLLIECVLSSSFADMSIAYDVVGLRGITARLLMPDGTKLDPIQTVIGPSKPDAQTGALKTFQRTNIFVFPLKPPSGSKPLIPPDIPSVRLVLEYQANAYAFDWENSIGKAEPPPALQKARELIESVDYNQLFGQVRRLAHMLD